MLQGIFYYIKLPSYLTNFLTDAPKLVGKLCSAFD